MGSEKTEEKRTPTKKELKVVFAMLLLDGDSKRCESECGDCEDCQFLEHMFKFRKYLNKIAGYIKREFVWDLYLISSSNESFLDLFLKAGITPAEWAEFQKNCGGKSKGTLFKETENYFATQKLGTSWAWGINTPPCPLCSKPANEGYFHDNRRAGCSDDTCPMSFDPDGIDYDSWIKICRVLLTPQAGCKPENKSQYSARQIDNITISARAAYRANQLPRGQEANMLLSLRGYLQEPGSIDNVCPECLGSGYPLEGGD